MLETEPNTLEALAQAVREAGYRAHIKEAPTYSFIETAASGFRLVLSSFPNAMQLRASFAPTEEMTLAAINNYNSKYRMAKLYSETFSDGSTSLFLEFDTLSPPEMSIEFINLFFQSFEKSLQILKEHQVSLMEKETELRGDPKHSLKSINNGP